MSRYYIHFKGKTMNPTALEDPAYEAAKRTWLCPGCCHPKPNVRHLDAHIQEERPDGPLNLISGCGLAIARKSFLMQFGEERVRSKLYIGDVYGPDGGRLLDWVTFRGKHGLIVRGTEHAGYRVCPECGRNLYFAMGKSYLYPQPPEGVELFESDLWGLILPEPIVLDLGIGKPRGVSVERLEVLKEPKDGLPALLF